MKDLPKVFPGPINDNISNNSRSTYSKLENEVVTQDLEYVTDKINKLFKSNDYIYSIDTVISFKDHKEKYTVIGKTNNHLVTKNQKLIPISDIYDIDLHN